jgi:copper(I)-binding protein
VGYGVSDSGRVLVEWDFGTTVPDMAHDLRQLLAPASGGTADRVRIEDAWARPSPPGASAGAVYMRLLSPLGDRLLGVVVDDSVAGGAEIHRTQKGPGGLTTMRPVETLDLPPGFVVELRPGGSHIMLVRLARPLIAGRAIDVRLRFERAGEGVWRVPVRSEPGN